MWLECIIEKGILIKKHYIEQKRKNFLQLVNSFFQRMPVYTNSLHNIQTSIYKTIVRRFCMFLHVVSWVYTYIYVLIACLDRRGFESAFPGSAETAWPPNPTHSQNTHQRGGGGGWGGGLTSKHTKYIFCTRLLNYAKVSCFKEYIVTFHAAGDFYL